MNEFLKEGGKSLKRLIPLLAFIILSIELIVNYLPFVEVKNEALVNQINEILGWVIASGFGFTAIEKFKKNNQPENIV